MGASTITQQFIKNAFLSQEKTLSRKLKEIALALRLDKDYTKNQIMEAYLNTILFGGNIYGIKMACKYYFNKLPSQITANEAAFLAGLVQSPNAYNPIKYPERANERKNVVLSLMKEMNFISEIEMISAQNESIADIINIGTFKKENYYSSYFDYLYTYMNQELTQSVIIDNQKIYTHLDEAIQKEIYSIMQNKYYFFPNDKIKCGIVLLDNSTGGVLGISGSRSNDRLVTNYALAPVQPGSTIKPILDYAPAIEYLHYSPATILIDEPYTYSNGSKIGNWDYQYKGPITLRKALSESRNIPALKVFQAVTKEKAKAFGLSLGLDIASDFYEADSIGGATIGYSLVSLANAYRTFANLGYYSKVTPIRRISNENIQRNDEDEKKLVMKPSTAFLINSILHDVFKGSNFDLKNTYLMAKTGQTNYPDYIKAKYSLPSNATKDSLVIAYTKDLTLGVFVSYDELSPTSYLDSQTKQIPRLIMYHLLSRFAKPNQYYQVPNDITVIKIRQEDDNIYLAKGNEIGSYYEYFRHGEELYTIKDSKNTKI